MAFEVKIAKVKDLIAYLQTRDPEATITITDPEWVDMGHVQGVLKPHKELDPSCVYLVCDCKEVA